MEFEWMQYEGRWLLQSPNTNLYVTITPWTEPDHNQGYWAVYTFDLDSPIFLSGLTDIETVKKAGVRLLMNTLIEALAGINKLL